MTIGLHMQSAQVLIQRNLQRARYSLPFFDPGLRDLITLIPPLLSEGSPSVGIYGRPGCSAREYKLLAGYLGRKPAIIADRLPDRVLIESLIALPMPSLAGRHSTSLMLVCLLRDEDYGEEVRAKIASVAQVFEKSGPLSPEWWAPARSGSSWSMISCAPALCLRANTRSRTKMPPLMHAST